jgi:site-specific recombinase XerD
MARKKKLPKILTDEEQKRMLEQINTRYPTPHRNLCMIRLMLDAGLRVGEVVALRPEHVNMQTCKLIVREGKGAKDREVWIPADLRDLIGSWLERRPASDYLFPTRTGSKVSTRYMREAVKRYAEKANVQEWEKVSPHTLRHMFATDFLNETGNIRLLQEILGHADISTTMIYTHVNDNDVREAMQAFRHRPDAQS